MSRQFSSQKRSYNCGDFSYQSCKKSCVSRSQVREVSIPNHHRRTVRNLKTVYLVINDNDVLTHFRFSFYKEDNDEKELRGKVARNMQYWVMQQMEYIGLSRLQEVFRHKWPVVINWRPAVDMDYLL